MKMKLLTASIVIGPLMLIGALPAVAGPSAPASGSRAAVQVAAANESAADRDSYTRRAQDELREWQHKLREFGDQAAASGKAAGNAAGSIPTTNEPDGEPTQISRCVDRRR